MIRKGKRAADNFTILANELLRDARLSLKARGLGAWYLSHTDEFLADLTQAKVAKLTGTGVDAISSANAELIEHGYMTSSRRRDGGRLQAGVDYFVTDQAQADESAGQTLNGISPDRESLDRETPAHKKSTSREKTNTTTDAPASGPQLALVPSDPQPVDAAVDKQPTVNQRAVKLAQAHYDRLGMGNVAAWVKIIKAALVRDYADADVDAALGYIAQHNWTLTEERLANTLRGGPKRPSAAPAATPQYRTSSGHRLEF